MLEYALVWISGLATFAMALLGAWVTGHDEEAKRQRWWVYAAFTVLGSMAVGVQIRQGYEAIKQGKLAQEANTRAEEARTELSQALKDLSTAAKNEAAVLANLKSAQDAQGKLQAKNTELFESNTKLAGETLQQVIGDQENPPFLSFHDFDFTKEDVSARAYLTNASRKYAARVVSITVQLEDQLYTSLAQDISSSSKEFMSRGPVTFPSLNGGDLNKVALTDLRKIGDIKPVELFIFTAIGTFRQRSILVRIDDKRIVQSWRVYKANDMSKTLVSLQETGFPRTIAWERIWSK